MRQNKVLILGVSAVLLILTTECYTQLAPADRPPPPPPPPPAIRFGNPETPQSQMIAEKVRYQLIPVQQSARSPPRGQPRSIDTYPAVSHAGYAQSRSTVQQQTNPSQRTDNQNRFAQSQTTIGYAQPQRTATPLAVSSNPQRTTIQHRAEYAQSQRTVIPQTVFSQPQRTIQPQAYAQTQRASAPPAGFVQPSRIMPGLITSHPAESHAQTQRKNQVQAVAARPQTIRASQPSFVPSLRTIAPYTSFPQHQSVRTPTQRTRNYQG